MSNLAITTLILGEALLLGAYLVSRSDLFIDHFDQTAEPVVSATWALVGIFPMALGALLIVAGLFMVRFSKAPTQRIARVSQVAVLFGVAMLGLVLFKAVQLVR